MEFQRLVWVTTLLSLVASSVASINYVKTSVSVANAELAECNEEGWCPMEFTATWHFGAGVDQANIGPIELGWTTVDYNNEQNDFWKSATSSRSAGGVGADYQAPAKVANRNMLNANTNYASVKWSSKFDGATAKFTVMIRDDYHQEGAKEKFGIVFSVLPSDEWNDITLTGHDGQACNSNLANGLPTTCLMAFGTILDDEDLTIFIDDTEGKEDFIGFGSVTSSFLFRVELSHKPDETMYIDWTIPAPVASKPHQAKRHILNPYTEGDYIFQTPLGQDFKTLVVQPSGQFNHLYLDVQVRNDNIQENLETFEVQLTYPGTSPNGKYAVDDVRYRKARIVAADPADTSGGRKACVDQGRSCLGRPAAQQSRLNGRGTFLEENEGAYVTVECPFGCVQEEGAGDDFVFDIKLSHKVDTRVPLTMQAVPATTDAAAGVWAAVDGADFQAREPSPLVFQPLEQLKQYRVLVVNDNVQSKHTLPINDQDSGAKSFLVRWEVDNSVWAGASNGGATFWNVYADKATSDMSLADAAYVPTTNMGQKQGQIYDDEGATFDVAANPSVSESAGAFTFTVTKSHATEADVNFLWKVASDDQLKAAAGENVKIAGVHKAGGCDASAAPGKCDLSWSAEKGDMPAAGGDGVPSVLAKNQCTADAVACQGAPNLITFSVIDDQVAEPAQEAFGIVIDWPEGKNIYKFTKSEGAHVSYVDDNDELRFGFTNSAGESQNFQVGEEQSEIQFTVYLDKVVSEYLALNIETRAATAGNTAEPADYTVTNTQVTVDQTYKPFFCEKAAGDAFNFNSNPDVYNGMCTGGQDGAFVIPVKINNDQIAEDGERLNLVLTTANAPNFRLANQEAVQQVHIVDDEDLRITVAGPGPLDESSDAFNFVASLNYVTDAAVNVPWAAQAQSGFAFANPATRSATAGSDFNPEDNEGLLKFAGNTAEAPTSNFKLNINNDDIQEHAEGSYESLWVAFNVGAAVPAGYFSDSTNDATWPTSVWSAGDAEDAKLIGAGKATEGTPKWRSEVQITDAEKPTLTVSGHDLLESAGQMLFVVTLSHDCIDDVAFDWSTSTSGVQANVDSAAGYVDYDAVVNGKDVILGVGKDGSRQTDLLVTIVNDQVAEHSEEVKVVVKNVTPKVNTAFNDASFEVTGLGTIIDDEYPNVHVEDAFGTESSGSMKFQITLSHLMSDKDGHLVSTALGIESSSGVAIEGVDYNAPEGSATIQAGSRTTEVTVTLNDDDIQEINENFSVKATVSQLADGSEHPLLNCPQCKTESKLQATGTIRDDEGTKAVLHAPAAADENDVAALTFVLRLDHEIAEYEDHSMSIMYNTVGQNDGDPSLTATGCDALSEYVTAPPQRINSMCDFVSVNGGTATFQNVAQEDGSNKGEAHIAIGIVNDHVQELRMAGETFKVFVDQSSLLPVELSQFSTVDHTGIQVTQNTATGTILDDEDVTIGVPPPDGKPVVGYTSTEIISFPVTLSHAVGARIELTYGTSTAGVAPSALTEDPFRVAVECPLNTPGEPADGCNMEPNAVTGERCDFCGKSGTLSFAPGGALVQNVQVQVAGADNIMTLSKFLDLRITNVMADGANPENIWGITVVADQNYGEIVDDEGVTLSISSASGTEDVGQLTFTITLSEPVQDAISVMWHTVDGGTATADVDYTANSGTVSFPSMADAQADGTTWPIAREVTVQVADDALVEHEEFFYIELVEGSISPTDWNNFLIFKDVDVDANGNPMGARGTIQQTSEGATLAVVDIAQAEASGNFQFTVTMSHDCSYAIDATVSVDHTASTAQTGVDFEPLATTTLPFAANAGADQSLQFGITVTDDEVTELEETIVIQFDAVRAADPLLTVVDMQTVSGTATIQNDDVANIAIAAASHAEQNDGSGHTVMSFPVSISRPVDAAISITYSTQLLPSALGAVADASDLQQVASASKGWGALSTDNLALDITITNDDVQEYNGEIFAVKIEQVNEAAYADRVVFATEDDSSAIGTILDAEGTAIAVHNANADETSGSMVFDVSLSHVISVDFSVNYATAAGTAKDDLDFTPQAGALTFATGQKASQQITVPLNDDFIQEFDETFTVGLTAVDAALATDYNVDVVATPATGTIDNDDEGCTVSVADVSGGEGTDFTFTFTLSHETDGTTTVKWQTAPGTAEMDQDYTENMGTVVFTGPAVTATSTVAVLNDDTLEPTERFSVTYEAPSNPKVTTPTNAEAHGYIVDDELATITIADSNAEEGAGVMGFAVTLSHALSEALDVVWQTEAGSAGAGSDFEAVTDGKLGFVASETPGQTRTLQVVLVNDDVQETNAEFTVSNEDFVVRLTGVEPQADPANFASEGFTYSFADADATGIILDDEHATIHVSDITTDERDVTLQFDITLSHAFDLAGSVFSLDYTTKSGPKNSAGACGTGDDCGVSDFETTSGSVTFTAAAAGEHRLVDVKVLNDDVQELDETFTLEITSVVHDANLDNSRSKKVGTCSIENDVEEATVRVLAPAFQSEGGYFATGMVFSVELSHAVSTPVKVTAATRDGSAKSNTADPVHFDYFADVQELTFPTVLEGSVSAPVVHFTVAVEDDGVEETTESFFVDLSALSSDAPVSLSAAMATAEAHILELEAEDSERLTIEIADNGNGMEGEDLTFEVTMSHSLDVDLTLQYIVTAKGAAGTRSASEADVQVKEGEILFAAYSGANHVETITVQIIPDDIVEPAETFEVHLFLPDSAEALSELTGRHIEFAERGNVGVGTIVDTDEAKASVSCITVAEEEGAEMHCPVTLTNVVADIVSVEYTTKLLVVGGDVRVANEDDFTTAEGVTHSIAANEFSADIIVSITNDNVQEREEALAVDIANLSVVSEADYGGRVTIDKASAQGKITDNEGVTVYISDGEVFECDGEQLCGASLTVTLSHSTEATVDVNWAISASDSTATLGEDYLNGVEGEASGTISFGVRSEGPALTEEISFFIVNNDIQEEYEENVRVELDGLLVSNKDIAAVVKYGQSSADLTIVDLEGAFLSVTGGESTEDDDAFVFQVEASHVFDPVLTITWTTLEDTATEDDYEFSSGVLNFNEGMMQGEITVAIKDDNIIERSESFHIHFTESDRYYISQDGVYAETVTATFPADSENNYRPTVNTNTVTECNGCDVTFELSFDHPVGDDVIFLTMVEVGQVSDYSFSATQEEDGDFAFAVGEHMLTSGDTGSWEVVVTLNGDDIHENPETFGLVTIMAGLGENYSAEDFGYTDTADAEAIIWVDEITILDDEGAKLNVDVPTVEEGETLTFSLSLSHEADGPRTFGWELTTSNLESAERRQDGLSHDEGQTAGQGTFTLSAENDWSATLTVATADDTLTEADETVDLTFDMGDDITFEWENARGVVLNNDYSSIEISHYTSVPEGTDFVIDFVLDRAVSNGFDITVNSVGGSAGRDDYTQIDETLGFAGTAGEKHSITIKTTADDLVEGTETIDTEFMIHSHIEGLTFRATGSQSFTQAVEVEDSDQATLTISSPSVEEGGNLVYTFALSKRVNVPVDVYWIVPGPNSGDIVGAQTGKVAFNAFSTEAAPVIIGTVDDNVVELDEQVRMTASLIVPGGLKASVERNVVFDTSEANACPEPVNGQQTLCVVGTIVNNDQTVLTIESLSDSVREGNDADFRLTLTNPVDVEFVVDIQPSPQRGSGVSTICCSNCGAGVGPDLSCAAQTVVVRANQVEKVFRVSTANDDLVETTEMFNLVLASPIDASGRPITSNPVLGSGSIADDDSATIRVDAGVGLESSGSVGMSLILSKPVDTDVTVTYTLASVDTTAGEDYPSGARALSYVIPAFTVSGLLPVAITNDGLIEKDETFRVTLQSAAADRQVSVATGSSAVGTIEDDERRNFSIDIGTARNVEVSEVSGPATFPIILSAPAQEAISVRVQAVSGTAIAGSDFGSPAPSDLVFQPGTTQIDVTVPIINDNVYEPQVEHFTLTATVEATLSSTGTTLSSVLASAAGAFERRVGISSEDPDNFAPVASAECTADAAQSSAVTGLEACFPLSACFSDSDGPSALSYSVLAGQGFLKTSGGVTSLCVNFASVGTYTVEAVANDGQSDSYPLVFSVAVTEPELSSDVWTADGYTFTADADKQGCLDLGLPSFAGIVGCGSSTAVTDVSMTCEVATMTSGAPGLHFCYQANLAAAGTIRVCTISRDAQGVESFTDDCFNLSIPASPRLKEFSTQALLPGDVSVLDLAAVSGSGAYTFSASSSNPGVVSVDVNGSTLTLTAGRAGTAVISYRVEDEKFFYDFNDFDAEVM